MTSRGALREHLQLAQRRVRPEAGRRDRFARRPPQVRRAPSSHVPTLPQLTLTPVLLQSAGRMFGRQRAVHRRQSALCRRVPARDGRAAQGRLWVWVDRRRGGAGRGLQSVGGPSVGVPQCPERHREGPSGIEDRWTKRLADWPGWLFFSAELRGAVALVVTIVRAPLCIISCSSRLVARLLRVKADQS